MLTMTLFALIWLILYTSLFALCGFRLIELSSRVSDRFAGLFASLFIAASAVVGSVFVLSYLVDPTTVVTAPASVSGADSTPPLAAGGPGRFPGWLLASMLFEIKSFFMGIVTSLIAGYVMFRYPKIFGDRR